MVRPWQTTTLDCGQGSGKVSDLEVKNIQRLPFRLKTAKREPLRRTALPQGARFFIIRWTGQDFPTRRAIFPGKWNTNASRFYNILI
jgi:hypothetical protein